MAFGCHYVTLIVVVVVVVVVAIVTVLKRYGITKVPRVHDMYARGL
jgi:hypothetical protein